MASRDPYGRRLFPTEDKALKAQYRAARYHGIWSGVIKTGEWWCLLFDPVLA